MDTEDLLIIFAENPEFGKVKKRLAKTVGDELALEIHIRLIGHTFMATKGLPCDKAVFYSNFVSETDIWERGGYEQHLQKGLDMGENLMNAFKIGFKRRYKKVVIIRSDCAGLRKTIVRKAFAVLDENEVVIGPATNGGYYLMGMKIVHTDLFKNKEWNTENVLLDTLIDLKKKNLTFKLLKTLTVVEEEKDLDSLPKEEKKQ